MLTRPRQIWVAYAIILTLLVAVFGWLTLRVLALDRRERLSQLQADQEERVRLALWRMEGVAMPIIAAEAARPYFTYQPYTQSPGGDESTRVPSPLLRTPSEYVLLNFQMDSAGRLESPQCPAEQDRPWACSNGTTPQMIDFCCPRLEELQTELPSARLLDQLPSDSTPVAVWSAPAAAGSAASESAFVQNSNTLQNAGGTPAEEPAQNQYASRASKLQFLAQKSALEQRQVLEAAWPSTPVREGVSRPLWIGGRLLLARRVEIGKESYVQGCWLDWERLRSELLGELSDTLPGASLAIVPVHETASPGRSLASLPVQLLVPPVVVDLQHWTPTQYALAFAWGALLLAGVALAVLLHGVASLSERRAAFVSAVTHELRTPLTTLQLYTDMLSGQMVPTESQRQEYMQTLQREAGRLSHLVENVLALSRLERKPSRRAAEPVSVRSLLERAAPRLRARADQGQRPLVLEIGPAVDDARINVEPTVIEQILLNLVDNACKHAVNQADPELRLSANVSCGQIEIRLSDRGAGLTSEAQRKLFRRFSKSDMEAAQTAPGLGLGLALSRDLARREGGDLQLQQTGRAGTTFLLTFRVSG